MSTDRVDAAELLLRLSIFGFSQLSASDQLQETEEVQNKLVHEGVPVREQLPEESEEDLRVRTFTELFKKLPFDEHHLFLSKVTSKFKRERQFGELISWFSELDSHEQQEVILRTVNVTADYDETSDEDALLERFSKLSRDYTNDVYNLLVPCMEEHRKNRKDKQKTAEEGTSSDWQSRFDEFYSGFSIVWFKAQSVDGQRSLIKHPNSARSVKGTVSRIINQILYKDRDKDFRLRKFSELLCTKALPFGIQAHFIDTVEKDLREQTSVPFGNFRTGSSFLKKQKIKKTAHGGAFIIRCGGGAGFGGGAECGGGGGGCGGGEEDGGEDGGGGETFALQFIKVKTPNLRGGGATAQGGGATAITQGK